jgi:hypothetical protein
VGAAFAVGLAGSAAGASAQIPGNTVKIGVLSDFSGPFADQTGKGSLVGAQLAAEDFAKEAGVAPPRHRRPDHKDNRPPTRPGPANSGGPSSYVRAEEVILQHRDTETRSYTEKTRH